MSFVSKFLKIVFIQCLILLGANSLLAQERFSIRDYVQLNAIAGAGENAPFWLVSNRNGLSSLDTHNGYIRYGVALDGTIDSCGKWRYSSGLDLKTGYNQEYGHVVQQLYADISYKWLTLSIGAKERAPEMRGFCSLGGINDNMAFNCSKMMAFNGLSELGTARMAHSRPLQQ